jgi:polyhydroxyalkanoate synthesis regulator phasin
MAATAKNVNGGRSMKFPEFLREPLEAAQARIEQIEEEAQRVLRDLVERGRASRKDLEQVVQRLSKQDWTFPEMKQRIEKLREQGVERAAEWRGRAETFRAEALDRVLDLQGRAIAFLGVASRDQVAEISREVDRLAKRIEKRARSRRARRGEA